MPDTNPSTVPVSPATMLEEALPKGRRLREKLLALPAVARSLRAVVVVAGGLRTEPITLRAAALTYLTVLSLVPLLAVVFSIFQAVVGTHTLQNELQAFVLSNLAVGSRASFQHYISQYVRRATGATLGGVGFVLLVASSVSLLMNVEAAFNHIFRAPRKRPLALRFGIYWCLLTLGPILLSLSLAGTALVGARALGPLRQVAGYLLPLLVTVGGFTLLYLILPAVPVKRRAALVGAAVAGTLWEVAKVVYAYVSAHSVRRDAIYGSISAVPTFLLWTYLSWIIVLFGARVAYAAQATSLAPAPGPAAPPLVRELAVARVMRLVAAAFQRGAAATVRTIAVELALDEGFVRGALGELALSGLVRELSSGGFLPARPLSQIRLREVREAARGLLAAPGAPLALPADLADLARRWERADEAAGARLNATLEELLADPDLPPRLVPPPAPPRG